MAVIFLNEFHEGRKTKASGSNHTYTRVWRARTDNPYDDGRVVLNALALGTFVDRNGVIQFCRRGAAHPTDADARCTDLEAVNSAEDSRQWVVTAEYSTDPFEWKVLPTDQPTTYTHSSEIIEQAIAEDLDGKIIENSAHDTFEQPATVDVDVTVIRAVCTRDSYSSAVDRTPFLRCVNSTGFTIDGEYFAPGQLLLDELTVDMVEDGGVFYRKFNYTFKGRSDLSTTTSATLGSDAGPGLACVIPLPGLTQEEIEAIVEGQWLTIGSETIKVLAVDVIGSAVIADLGSAHSSGATVTITNYCAWDYMPLDLGFSYISAAGSPPKKSPFMDGPQVSQVPRLLDGEGGALATWTIPPQKPVRLIFRTRKRVDFNTIARFP